MAIAIALRVAGRGHVSCDGLSSYASPYNVFSSFWRYEISPGSVGYLENLEAGGSGS
jgi:hypothetical protein